MNADSYQDDGVELPIRRYLMSVSRRKWTAVSVALVVMTAALLSSLQQRAVYEARAEILLQPSGMDSVFDTGEVQSALTPVAIQTEIRILSSRPVREAVEKKLGPPPTVSAKQVEGTQVLAVRVRNTSPKLAAAFANAYATAYIDFRRTQAVEAVLAVAEKVQAKLNELQEQSAALDTRFPALPGQPTTVADQQLIDQRNRISQQQLAYRERLDRAQLDASLKNGGAQIVTAALVPTSPVEPRPARSLALGTAVGLVLGAGLALLLDTFDDRIKSREDLEGARRDLPVAGTVPQVPPRTMRQYPIAIAADPPTAAAEAYRSLRTTLQFMVPGDRTPVLQVTSPAPGDGKTTVVANLAVAMAEAGQRVAVVSCDLRRPRVHAAFGLSNEVGFTSVLLQGIPVAEALQHVAEHGQLYVLTSGPEVVNPSELLASRRTPQVLAALGREADVVLVDSPPVLPVSDAAVVASMVDATLLVARMNSTTRKALVRSAEILGQVDARVLGTILNGVVHKKGGYEYAYGYSYFYRANENGHASTARATKSVPAAVRMPK